MKTDADIAGALLGASRDSTFSLHMRTWARYTTSAGARAYLYWFSHVPPHPRAAELKAFHASEIPYVFNVVPSNDPREAGFAYTPADRSLAATMSAYWVNFVKTGDPNGSGLPAWAPYKTRTMKRFSNSPTRRARDSTCSRRSSISSSDIKPLKSSSTETAFRRPAPA